MISALLAISLVILGIPARALEEVGPEWNVKVPIEVIRQRCAGGTEYLDKYGVTRKSLLKELQSHEHDDFYLGTPYVGGDWQSPRGDTSYNGRIGMNCAGFVACVLRRSGMDGDQVTAVMQQSPTALTWGSGLAYPYLSGASNYLSLIEYGHLTAHVYETKWALLADGKAEKGDLVMRFWTDQFSAYDVDNHLMVYWGDTPYEDKVWQSVVTGNSIGAIANTPASAFVLIKFAPEPPFAGYNDVHEGDWYAPAVQFVKENGYMQGTPGALFEPLGTVTRAQAVQVLYNLAGRPEPSEEPLPFTDVPSNHWALPAIRWAYEAEVAGGVDGEHFAPEDPLTREQAAQLFWGFAGSPPADAGSLSSFGDCALASPWAQEGLAWAVGSGVISGSGGLLNPQGPCTRGQLAQIIQNYAERGPAL